MLRAKVYHYSHLKFAHWAYPLLQAHLTGTLKPTGDDVRLWHTTLRYCDEDVRLLTNILTSNNAF